MMAIYRRVSTDMQDTDSQACAIDKFIAEKFEPHCKFTVFEDLAKSGKDENRPAFRRLIAAIEAKEVTAVIVYRLDRLSRSSLSALRLLIDWIQRGVSFYAVDQPILQLGPENPFRLTFAAMMAEIAQIERETLISRIKSGIEARRKRGEHVGSLPKLRGAKLEKAKALRAGGATYAEIGQAMGVTTRTVLRALGRLGARSS